MTSYLFPGQGAVPPGLGEETRRARPDLAEAAARAAGDDVFARAGEGTRWAQPALVCAALARWTALGPPQDAEALLGHSLGELTALAAAGALAPEDAVRLACARGRLMEEAGIACPGGMVALLGAELPDAAELAAELGLVVANDNAPGQVVLAGPPEGVRAARAGARARGLRALALDVSGAFHSPAMASAQPGWEAALDTVEFAAPRIPVVSCLTAEWVTDARATLAAGLTSPVRFREALEALGGEEIVDVGPGEVLAGLARRTRPEARVSAARPPEVVGA